jgi:hypothetical protein
MNDGRVQFFTIPPGNLYSAPQLVHTGSPTTDGTLSIMLDNIVPSS